MKRLYFRLWPYVKRHLSLLCWGIFFITLSTACTLLTPWVIGKSIDSYVLTKNTLAILYVTLTIFFLELIKATASFQQNMVIGLLGQRVLHQLRQDLLKHYEFYPVEEFNRTPTGRLVTRLVNDTSSLQDLFTGGLAIALGEIVAILGILIWLVILNVKLGLVCISIFPVMAIVARFFGKRIHRAFQDSRNALSLLNSFLAENISGMSVIQIFNRQKEFYKKFRSHSQTFTKHQQASIQNFAIFQPIITILGSISMSLLIWYGGFLTLDHAVSLGLLITFISYLQSLYTPIRTITEKYNLFLSALTSSERIFEFLDRPIERGISTKKDFSHQEISNRIEFKNLWFSYSNEEQNKWVLKNLTFTINAAEKIGIVGPTGAGKTSLISLLLRFYEPQKGTIYFGNKVLSEIEKRSLRSKIGYIQQQPILFKGTVEDNILLWNVEGKKNLKFLMEFADPFLKNLGFTLNKTIDEKGMNLSSGERQVISFFRALVADPPIYILDEATAHLDSITESWIEKISETFFVNKTVILIAHRLSTLKKVNRIFVLNSGELVEEGTHETLMKKNGLYKTLYEIQSRRKELQDYELES